MQSILENTTKNPSASLVVISSDDLVRAIETLYSSARQDAISQIRDNVQSFEKEEMLSAKEARLLLKKSHNTLWKWAKRGYLVPIKVGGTLMYKRSDLNKIMGL